MLLIRAGGAIGDAVARRLVSVGDEVRVVERSPEVAGAWRALGVHAALGADDDHDLIERAAQNVRTIVLVEDEAGPARDVIDAVIAGAKAAGVERIVYVSRRPTDAVVTALRAWGADYVVLTTRGKGILGKPAPPELIAEAVDAADDISGHPRLEVDLSDPTSVRPLGLDF